MLYVCATPIGNLGDVTLRVLETLRDVDLIAAEDTRHTRKLLARYDIHTSLTSFFAHNEAPKTEYVLGLLRNGKAVALVTDAGMPGVSDPGMRLVASAVAAGLDLTVLPGASAALTGFVASGLADETGFRFVGFLPRKQAALCAAWRAWQYQGGVVVAFESGSRLAKSLAWLAEVAPQARGAVCRELTKVHEEVVRGSLDELAMRFSEPVRGEVTVVLDSGPAAAGRPSAAGDPESASAAATLLARGLSRRDTAVALSVCLRVPHREAERLARETAARRARAGRIEPGSESAVK
ncbi:MAG: 16S rRNA (cytidine(1402)-2'-O)-methyltransferase [Thermoleophilia bacterium]